MKSLLRFCGGLAAGILLTSGVEAQSCFGNPLCRSDGAPACKKALERFEDTGVYNGYANYVGRNGKVECSATYNCNSGGSWMQISGADLKRT